MPRRLRFRIRALAELHRQLGYAPDEARRRHMLNAEQFLARLDPGRNYSSVEVVRAITGYRPDRSDGAMLVGEALRSDLTTLVQRLSETLDLAEDDRPGGAESVEAISERLGITVRTVQRWRRAGLLLHRIRFHDGVVRLGCFTEQLDRFLAQRAPASPAARARRTDSAERDAIVGLVRDRVERHGDTLGSAMRHAIQRSGRSAETVRRVLRHDDRGLDTVRGRRSAVPTRAIRRFVERAWRWGIPASRIARRCDRSEPAIHRQLMVARRDRLFELELGWVELPTFSLPDAEAVILMAPAAQRGLHRLWSGPDVHATLAMIRERSAVDDDLQEARLAASGLLRRRVSLAVAGLRAEGGVPNAARLDRMETDLRWATLLLLTAIADELPASILQGERICGRAAERLSGETLLQLIRTAIAVAAETLPATDPTRRQRPSRRMSLALDKALARLGWGERRGRAVATTPVSAPMEVDPCANAFAWQSAIDLPPRWPRRLGELDAQMRDAVVLRHGLDGAPPRTIELVAKALAMTPSHAARLAHVAETTLRCGASGR